MLGSIDHLGQHVLRLGREQLGHLVARQPVTSFGRGPVGHHLRVLGDQGAWRLYLATASMTRITWGAEGPVLNRFNETPWSTPG